MKKKEDKETLKNEIVPMEEKATQVASFGTEKPSDLVKKATQVANELSPIVDKRKLYTNISGKKYVQAEGWTTMGAMLGAFPEVEWTKKMSNGWEARVNVRTLQGQVISSAEAMCTRDEKNWRNRDEYALRSMAQTRATGKAFRLPFAWIMALAGYEATPAEEIGETYGRQSDQPRLLTQKQSIKIYTLIYEINKVGDKKVSKEEFEQAIKKPIKTLTIDQAAKMIDGLEKRLAEIKLKNEDSQEAVTANEDDDAQEEAQVEEEQKEPDLSDPTDEEMDEMMKQADAPQE